MRSRTSGDAEMSTDNSSFKLKKKITTTKTGKIAHPSVAVTANTPIQKKKKEQQPTLEKGEKRLAIVKSKVLVEEQAVVELMDKMKTRIVKTNEDDHLQVYMDMYNKQRRIIRKLEKECLNSKNSQGVYQLATLYTQLRETIASIQNLTDLSEHAEILIERVMRPIFTEIIQDIASTMYVVKLKIKDRLQEKTVKRTFTDIDDITIESGKKLQLSYQKVCESIRQNLIGG